MATNDRIQRERRRRRRRAVWRGRARDGGSPVPEPGRESVDAEAATLEGRSRAEAQTFTGEAAETLDGEAAETIDGAPHLLGPYETRYEVARGYDDAPDIIRP